MKNQNVRYDPLYRIIDEKPEMKIVEGRYNSLFIRLKNINNLGLIPKVLEGARHSKYEHHTGTTFQIYSLVENNYIKDEYKKPLIISTLFLHLGHLPFTYSTEKAVLIAANLDNNIKNKIEIRIDKIFSETDIDNRDERKKELFELRNYKLFYKYNSAFILNEKWNKFKEDLKLDDFQKKIALKNLIDYENSDGYKYIQLADKADYVQRDALYFGSARLDLSPKHLYSKDPLTESDNSYDEWSLIDINLRYLQETYYQDVNVRSFSRIYEKIIGKLIINPNFNINWLFEYNDDEFETLIMKKRTPENKVVKIPSYLNKRIINLFKNKYNYSLLFSLNNVHFPENTVIQLEKKVIGLKSDITLLDYPFKNGILLDIDYDDSQMCSFLSQSHKDYTQYSINVFQDDKNLKMVELMKCLNNISKNCSVTHIKTIKHHIGKQFSWTNNCRIDNGSIIKAITEIIISMEKEKTINQTSQVIKFLYDLQEIKTFKDIWRDPENGLGIRIIESTIKEINTDNSEIENNFGIYESLVEMILGLPLKLLQFKKTKSFIKNIVDKIKEEGPSKPPEIRGNFFEAYSLY